MPHSWDPLYSQRLNKEIENFNLTQKMPKNNYNIDNIINNSLNNQQNVLSEKILYDFNNSEII